MTAMLELVIYGTGGFAREVHQIVEDVNEDGNRFRFLGWLDDDLGKAGKEVHATPVLGSADWLEAHPSVGVLVGVGATHARRRLVRRIVDHAGNPFPTLVHPLAWVGNRVTIGDGTIVCAGNLITTDIVIGRHVILGVDCTVGHDTVLEDFVTVAPGVNISGTVRIGEGCDLGTGAKIIQGISLGHWSVVGAGAVVIRDLRANVTAVGVPANPIKERPQGWHEFELSE